MGLVIQRKLQQAVHIGGAVIRVVQIRGGSVKLHIEADGQSIMREELINVRGNGLGTGPDRATAAVHSLGGPGVS